MPSRWPAKVARFVIPGGLWDAYAAAKQKRRARRFVEPLFKLPRRPVSEIFPGIERESVRLTLAHVPDRPEMLTPSGVIIWDDYLWDRKYPECAGVTRCLDRLSADFDIANIEGTRLAVYRR